MLSRIAWRRSSWEALKRAFSRWIVLHVAAALVFYPLLALHVWSGIYYGLRWLP